MPKFVDIASLSEKVLDGSEVVQVSATQKARLVRILTQLGDKLEMAVNGSESWQLPGFDTKNTPVQNWLNALAFACGLRDESTGWGPFRIVNGNDGDIAYFVPIWYDNINDYTYACVIGSYPEKVITLYEKSGKQHLTAGSDQDSAVIQDIISTGGWTKVATLGADSAIKQTYGVNTQFLAPVQGAEVLLTTTIERILYAIGFRGTNTGFRFLTGVANTSSTYMGVTFYNSGQSKTFTVLFGVGGSADKVSMYQKSGDVTEQKPIDSEYIQDVLGTWTKSWVLNGDGISTVYTSDVIAADSSKPITLASTFAFPNLSNLKLDELVKNLLYNVGYHSANMCSRQLQASYVIGGSGSNVQCYYGVTWYNSYYGRTYTMLVNIEKTDNEFITIYQKQGKQIERYPSDSDYVKNVIDTWTKTASIGSGGGSPEPITSLEASKVVVSVPTLFTDESGPTVMPSDQNNAQELFQWILYRLGVRDSAEGIPETWRFAAAGGKAAVIFSEPSSSNYMAYVFDSSGSLSVYSLDAAYVIDWVGSCASDKDAMTSIIDNGTLLTSVSLPDINPANFATKSYVRPSDAVLTSFPSGTRTILPGENITTNLTSGTLSVQVGTTFSASQKQGPFRDAVIDVPYGVKVNFKNQAGVVYRTDEVDSLVATSGRKVYTIHWVPTSTAASNVPIRAFVNVANYK
jgi:hypothetical protein